MLKILLFIGATLLVLGIMFLIAIFIDSKEHKYRIVMEELDAWKESLFPLDENKEKERNTENTEKHA